MFPDARQDEDGEDLLVANPNTGMHGSFKNMDSDHDDDGPPESDSDEDGSDESSVPVPP